MFDDPVGKRCGDHIQPFLLQTYRRDTGEIMHDISAPIMSRDVIGVASVSVTRLIFDVLAWLAWC